MFEIPRPNVDLTIAALKSFVRSEHAATGAASLVLGLSGGIDSAVVALLAANAASGTPLHLFWLPYKTSDPRSYEDAAKVAALLGIELKERPITEVVDAAISQWKIVDKLRIGNLAARARMMALFDASAEYGGVVLGTSNLSERLLGYGTLHGDLACAFNPLGNILKTELRAIAPTLGVPESIIEKAPTADLWAGQTDEGELGFTYADADRVLYLRFRIGLSRGEISAIGLDRVLIDKVLDRVERSAFKSRPIPLGPAPQ
ncbi:MAG: NAD+ synthase [Candidatus Brocadiia bacterium]